MFVETFSFTNVLFIALDHNHIYNIERRARNTRFDGVCFTIYTRSVLITTVFNVRTSSKVGNITSEVAGNFVLSLLKFLSN